MYGSRRTNMPYAEYLTMLRDAGLGSIPGTAAEILSHFQEESLESLFIRVARGGEVEAAADPQPVTSDQ